MEYKLRYNRFATRWDDETARCIAVDLQREIDELKKELISIDTDITIFKKSTGSISDNIKRIAVLLQKISDNKLYFSRNGSTPTYDLLSLQALKRTEIPLDVLDMLISTELDDTITSTLYPLDQCLDVAAKNRHYNAAR